MVAETGGSLAILFASLHSPSLKFISEAAVPAVKSPYRASPQIPSQLTWLWVSYVGVVVEGKWGGSK